MTRIFYQRDLKSLEHSVVTLGSMAATSVETAMSALSLRSAALAQSVIDHDDDIDERERVIEEHGMLLIATQQPMAGDLRAILAAFAISQELERIGDYAEGIAKIALSNLDAPPLPPAAPLHATYRMADTVTTMLRNSLEAFVERDLEAAKRIWNEDDGVDVTNHNIYASAQQYMITHPDSIERVTRLLWVAHNLERIADRVTNICERVTTMVTGERARLKVGLAQG